MEHACLHMADEDHFNSNYNEFNIFYPTIINHIHTNINAIVEITEKLKDDNSENDNRVVTTNMYNMNARLNYKTLYKMSTNVKLQMAK